MTDTTQGWPTPAQAAFARALLETFQGDLERRYPGCGKNLFVHVVLLGAAELFHSLVEEDDLADILNAGLQSRALPWRVVRTA